MRLLLTRAPTSGSGDLHSCVRLGWVPRDPKGPHSASHTASEALSVESERRSVHPATCSLGCVEGKKGGGFEKALDVGL